MRFRDRSGLPVLGHLSDRGLSPNTWCAYAYDLKYLFTFLARKSLDWRDFRAPDALRLLGFLRRQPSRRPAQRPLMATADCQAGPLRRPRRSTQGSRS
ncbi:site-specific integrase [Streptomyces sp. NPDC051320]|uniref:site-specific integrase n=1 Tax=Streptomyces sp. NPDC051320 TaxID=3154644 RepID=UPI00341A73C2